VIGRARLAVATALVAGLALLVLSGVAGARGSTTIQVGDDYFSPTKETVSAGTKVKFKWVGDDKHNVVKKSGPGGGFESGVTDDRGVNFKKKFKKAGKYKIVCTIHEGMDMKLKVKN
jgi:plastocyanin